MGLQAEEEKKEKGGKKEEEETFTFKLFTRSSSNPNKAVRKEEQHLLCRPKNARQV